MCEIVVLTFFSFLAPVHVYPNTLLHKQGGDDAPCSHKPKTTIPAVNIPEKKVGFLVILCCPALLRRGPATYCVAKVCDMLRSITRTKSFKTPGPKNRRDLGISSIRVASPLDAPARRRKQKERAAIFKTMTAQKIAEITGFQTKPRKCLTTLPTLCRSS